MTLEKRVKGMDRRLLNEVSTRMVEAWSDLQATVERTGYNIITGGSNTDSTAPAAFRTVCFSHSLVAKV
jgi:hypothetical protein